MKQRLAMSAPSAPETPVVTYAEFLQDTLCLKTTSIKGKIFYEYPSSCKGPGFLMGTNKIGMFTYFGAGCGVKDTSFGRFCSAGKNVTFNPSMHPVLNLTTHPVGYRKAPFLDPEIYKAYCMEARPKVPNNGEKPLTIGSDVWIGEGALIMGNLTVGDGAVIGAHAVVTKDVPPYAIVGGVPARVIRLRFPEPLVKKMTKLQWWKYDYTRFKDSIDFNDVEKCVDRMQELADAGLMKENPVVYKLFQR